MSVLNYVQSVYDLSIRIRTGKILHGFHPIPIVEFVTMFEHGENRHHALQGPDTDVLALRNSQFGILDKEMITHLHREVAVTVDPLHSNFYFGHSPSPTYLLIVTVIRHQTQIQKVAGDFFVTRKKYF